MIQATFKEQGEDMVAMTVEGHAMSAEYGGYLYCELPQGLSDAQKQVAQILMKNCYLALKEDVAKSAPESLQVILIH